MSRRQEWERAYDESGVATDAGAKTASGIPLQAVYGPDDGEFPGVYPFTRGPYASMYRTKAWTQRMFAGFGTVDDTNRRFHLLLDAGGDGLSVAFDLPTLMGYDSDHPLAEGEVGRGGVAVDTVDDMAGLFAGIDLGAVSTSMTINSPAAVALAMYVVVADDGGVPRPQLRGTLQNDILKEYQAQKEFIFPPRPSMRLVTDVVRFCTAEMPRWHPLSVSGYHIREAGSTAVQELAFTLANGFAYVEAAVEAGLAVDEFAPRMSFFFNAHIDFFEEVAKYRAARRLWARWLRDRYGASDPRSLRLRFHAQTAGASLTAQQPELNVVRTAIEALAAVLGGTQSLHTNGADEVLSLPTDESARVALRTQQVIAHETGVAEVADPLGGSWLVESLTDEMERQAAAVLGRVDEAGHGSLLDGVRSGIENGWFQAQITEAAYRLERELSDGDRVVVGVNRFQNPSDDGSPSSMPLLRIGADVEEDQRKRLAEGKASRDQAAVTTALSAVSQAAQASDVNVMPALLDAVRARATEGEIVDTLASVFGRWRESSAL